MTSQNDIPDREETLKKNFDPSNLEAWKALSTRDFIKTVVHEIRRENVTLLTWLNWLNDQASRDLTQEGEMVTISVSSSIYHMDELLKATRIISHLLDVMSAYSEEIEVKKD